MATEHTKATSPTLPCSPAPVSDVVAVRIIFDPGERLCSVRQPTRGECEARRPAAPGGEREADYLGSLVLEPHLDHADTQPRLCSQRLPHLEETER